LHVVAALEETSPRVYIITAYEPDRPICSGRKKPGTTTFTADLEFGVVVVRKVPATVCSQCGADWIEDKIARQLEDIVKDARKRRMQVEVTSFS
jgi:YgiT-type zinc finger domain-containing protein